MENESKCGESEMKFPLVRSKKIGGRRRKGEKGKEKKRNEKKKKKGKEKKEKKRKENEENQKRCGRPVRDRKKKEKKRLQFSVFRRSEVDSLRTKVCLLDKSYE